MINGYLPVIYRRWPMIFGTIHINMQQAEEKQPVLPE